MVRLASWAPTIAVSWLWGFAFFFAFHVTLTDGWPGFLAFALPSAGGLFAFGWILGDKRRDVVAIFRSVQARYAGLFLTCQVLTVAITLFAAIAYLFVPLFGPASIPMGAIFVLLATTIGHAAPLGGLKIVHAIALAAGLIAAVVLLAGLVPLKPAQALLASSFDARQFGLVLPALVGLVLGPWMDVRQWQRAVAIRREGGSVRLAYAGAALLFLGLLAINAVLAMSVGPALTITTSDGRGALQAAVAGAAVHAGSHALVVAYFVWGATAVAATLDSSYLATRWLLRETASKSDNALLAFVPVALVTSPLWFLLTAVLVAALAIATNVSMIYLMMPFATLLAGAAACLVCETIRPRRGYDVVLCMMIGTASLLILVTGYIGNQPAMMALAPFIGLIGALPAVQALFAPPVADAAAAAAAAAAAEAGTKPIQAVRVQADEAVLAHGFDGQWFVMHLIPTYDDTNSVGNVYFANYFRWVGKGRELLFDSCMPNFDLRHTDFYILTKSFAHDFRREIREFHPVTVRLKIGSYNRKFVTLVHEIHSRNDGLIGKGEQTIMFVDSVHFKPLDIPPVVLRSFMPYFANAVRGNAAAARLAS